MSKIEHFAIFTHDLDALRDFYTEVFGLRILLDNSLAPVRGYFLTDDAGSVIEIIERPPHQPPPPTRYTCHVALWVDDYDSVRRSLEDRGAIFEEDSEVRSDSFRTGFFADPAGNRTQIVWRSRPLGS